MATLTDQIDRFVRWFFNSSPDQTSIEPGPRIEQRRSEPRPARSRRAGSERRSGKDHHRSTSKRVPARVVA